jgi:aminomethyltransferase
MIRTATASSPLLGEHENLRAQFTDFAGWQMPLKYDSELAEHHAVRTAAGLFDLSHMGEIAVDGPGAGAVLDYALAGELSNIAVGKAKYSLLCNSAGGVIDDLVVYRTAEDSFLVVANAANSATVYREIVSRASGFAAAVHNHTAETALIAVQGPAAADIVCALVPDEDIALVEGLKYYSATAAVVGGLDVLLARTGYTGEDGFELYVHTDRAVALWRALLDQTRACGGSPAGLACRDTLRLEAGMALYGHELTIDTNPYEAGLGRVVKLSKNFVGRDALNHLAEHDPGRRLVGLAGGGRRAARAGYPIFHAGCDAPVGAITSGALSPTLGHPIALAYVDAAVAEPGTELTVDIRGKTEPFSVTATPFYRRP